LPVIGPESMSGTLTINGNGATISGNDERRILYTFMGANLTLNNLTITAGNAGVYNGGGIYSPGSTLTLTDVIISGSAADHGGGIYLDDGSLMLSDSTVSGNEAVENGGGIHVHGDGTIVVLADTTVSHNTADVEGGGIYV